MPHRRADGEVVGWIEMAGEGFRPYDLLGRPLAEAGPWSDAEELLESHGLAWLAEPQLARLGPGEERRVRITEVTRGHVALVADDFGISQAVGAEGLQRWTLPLPLETELRPLR